MHRPKLIVLNGFAGTGKSSIGKKYIDEHPLSLLIEGDELIVNLGQWLKHEADARNIIFELTKNLTQTHLENGYDVVLPYLVTNHAHVTAFEQIAEHCNAAYFNFLLSNEKEAAIAKLMERGTWGEAGLDPLTEKDMPVISDLYDRMESQIESQKGIITIHQAGNTPEQTYAAILKHISKS